MLNSIRTRLTLIFVVLTLAPLLIATTQIGSRGYSTLQEQSVEFQDEVARRAALDLASFFRERQAELLALTNIYGLDTLDLQGQRDVLSALISQQSAYYQVELVEGTGRELLHITRGEVIAEGHLLQWADDPLFIEAVETRAVTFGPVYFNEAARDRLITMAIPVENLFTGDIGYVLLVDIRFQNVADSVLRNLGAATGEDVYIVNPDGVIVAHRDPNLVIREKVTTIPETEGLNIGLSGEEVILATETIRLANQSLIVVSETTVANATALANELSGIAVVITLITVILAVAVVTYTVSRVTDPILAMSQVARAVQQGDLSARANEQGRDEIAVLGQAFNQMTGELRRTLDGLKHNVQQLEASNQEREVLIKDLQFAKRIAEENSRLKSEFLATMSHELRTPMNAIEGFTGIMLKRMAGVEFNSKTERYLGKIQANSQRLLGLINDFLDLSRIESGRLELANMPLAPYELARRWQENLSVLADNKGLALDVRVDPNLPTTVYGDEEALSKIAINLIGNAIKFTETGSVMARLEQRDRQIALEVRDTGIGIPPHAREFIFDEFRQVDQSSKRKFGGSGLGLAIVQKLVRGMGGTVTLQSEVGVGSTFTVLIPLQVEAVPTLPAPAVMVTATGN